MFAVFQKSYWCGTIPDEFVPEDKNISMGQDPKFFEADPKGIRPGIKIRNLRKVGWDQHMDSAISSCF